MKSPSQQIRSCEPDSFNDAGHAAWAVAASTAAHQFLAVAVLILILMVLRKPDTLLNPQFWAEDGLVYFSQALATGPASVFMPYNACLWILPRLIALAVTLLPVLWAPFAFNLIALIMDAACCALFSLPAYRHLVRSDWLRIGCCALFAVASSAGNEMIGTVTNIPWYLGLAAVGALALQPEKSVARMRSRRILSIAAGAAICAVSSPVVLVAAPLALWQAFRAVARRNWKMLAVSAALLAGMLIQGLVDFTVINGGGLAGALLIPNLPLALLFPGLLRLTLGEGIAMALAARLMWPAAIGVSLAIAVWLGFLWRRLKISYLLSALVLIAGPVAMAIVGRHSVFATRTGIILWGANRYFLLPGCAFIFLLAAWIDSFPKFRFSLLALITPFILGIAGNFEVPPYQDFDWPSHAHAARRWLTTGCEVSIPIPPGSPWEVELPGLSPVEESACGPAAGILAPATEPAAVAPPVFPLPEASRTSLWLPGGPPPQTSNAKVESDIRWIEVTPTTGHPQLLFDIGRSLGRFQTLIVRALFQKADRIDAFFGRQVDGRGVSGRVPTAGQWLDVYLNMSHNQFWKTEHGTTLRFDPASSMGPRTTAYIAGVWGSVQGAPPAWPPVQFYPVPTAQAPDAPAR